MINVIAQFQTTLTSGISSTAVGGTFESNASADNDGETLPNGDYGIVIDEGNNRREYATITLTGLDFVFIKRGLSVIDGDTVKAGNQFAHRKGAVIKIVSHPVIALMVNVFNGTAPLTGIIYNDAARTYTSDFQLVDKKYVDDLAIAGSPKASETVYGIAKLSSAAATPAAPVVLNSEEVVVVPAANKVPRANSSGKVDHDFISDGATSGLEEGAGNGTQVKIKSTGRLVRDSNGLSVDEGTTANKVVVLDSNAKIPAVDGSQLTNMSSSGVITDLGTTASANNDISVTLPFKASVIKLYYWIQGHDGNSETAKYFQEKGEAIFNDTSISVKNIYWRITGAADNAIANASYGTGVTFPVDNIDVSNPTRGTTGVGGIQITLSIPSNSSTGFTIRRATSNNSSSAYARASIAWEAYR